jgi:AraC-like DNA-binding protein
MQRFGGNFQDLLKLLGVSEHVFLNSELDLGVEKESKCWEYAIKCSSIADFGLITAIDHPMDMWVERLYAKQNQNYLLEQVIDDLAQLLMHKSGYSMKINQSFIDEGWLIEINSDEEWIDFFPLLRNSFLEFMASLTRVISKISSLYAHPKLITFMHRFPDPFLAYASFWGKTEMKFRKSRYSILYPTHVGKQEVQIPHLSELHIAFDPMSKTLIRRGQADFKELVVQSLKLHPPDENVTIKEVAKSLHISERTIQLKLKKRNTSFHQVYLETKMDLAKTHLGLGRLSISEISQMLGYADISSFSRAFKKLTGESPMAYKKSQKGMF